jgi:hypothetical protein
MKRQHNDPKPNYALYGKQPARKVKLHVNAQLPPPMEIRPRPGVRFAHETLEQFTALLQHTPDTVHIRVIVDDARRLVSTPTTGYKLVDEVWWRNRIKRFSFHATDKSIVRFEKRSTLVDQIHLTDGTVYLYTEDETCVATINVPIILLLSSGSIILGEEGEF